jgi:ADP-ribose pyrophosphatase
MKTLKPWTVVDEKVVFSGGPISQVVKERVRLPDGRVVPDYYRVRMNDFALAFASVPDGRVLVFRHYRHGPARICLGFPGGAMASGESPEDAIRRELLEETGYASSSWQSLGAYVTNANQGCNAAHLFRATDCRLIAEPGSGDLEEAELLFFQPDELLNPDRLAEIGLASHVALLLLATHPALHFT